MSTDRDWEEWGAADPYFGVLSEDRYRRSDLTDTDRAEFFRTGEQHVDFVLATIRRVFDSEFAPARVLDFGCGVGRLLVAFGQRGAAVTGVDVSQSMLDEARANCAAMGVDDVTLLPSDDALSSVTDPFELVHSCLVLQHIPWRRGRLLISKLLARVDTGGFAAVQFYYRCNAPRLERALVRLRYSSRAVNAVRNLLRGSPMSEPPMQLHVYDLPHILRELRRQGFTDVHQHLDSVADGVFESVTLFARRDRVPAP
ncbi:MAG: class I SAM-dependent methyltransferase [Woeseiaceae bacterium]|nr:class I SAM-dependent methyltransferase [Woeseiaceae bacterium]